MTRRILLLVTAAFLAAGCASRSAQLVGIWKGDVAPETAAAQPSSGQSQNPSAEAIGKALEGAVKGFINAFVGPMTIEFNADGKYKISLNLGSETGTYTVTGNEVTLTPDKPEDNKNMKLNLSKLILSDDGKTLSTKKEFQSDSVLVLKKQNWPVQSRL